MSIQLKNVTFEIAQLPDGVRTVTPVNLTVAAAAVAGANSISLSQTSGSAVQLRRGQSFSVLNATLNRRVQVLVTADTSIPTGGAGTPVPVSELLDPVENASVLVYRNLYPVAGVQTFDYQTSPQNVDTTDTLSGTGMESAYVRNDRTMNFSLIVRPNNRGYWDQLVPLVESVGLFGREAFAVVTYPNGMQRIGAVKFSQFSEPGNQNEVFKSSFTIQFQGDSYSRSAPYSFA